MTTATTASRPTVWRVRVLGTDDVNGQAIGFGFVQDAGTAYQAPVTDPEDVVFRITAEQRARIQELYDADVAEQAELDVPEADLLCTA